MKSLMIGLLMLFCVSVVFGGIVAKKVVKGNPGNPNSISKRIQIIKGVNIRTDHTTASAITWVAVKGTIYELLTDYAYYVKIQAETITGWVYEPYLGKVSVNVYSKSDTKSTEFKIGVLKNTQKYTIIDRSVKWYKIPAGWVSSTYAKILP